MIAWERNTRNALAADGCPEIRQKKQRPQYNVAIRITILSLW